MDVFQATQHLVQEELVMLWCQIIIGFDDLNSTLLISAKAVQVVMPKQATCGTPSARVRFLKLEQASNLVCCIMREQSLARLSSGRQVDTQQGA